MTYSLAWEKAVLSFTALRDWQSEEDKGAVAVSVLKTKGTDAWKYRICCQVSDPTSATEKQ